MNKAVVRILIAVSLVCLLLAGCGKKDAEGKQKIKTVGFVQTGYEIDWNKAFVASCEETFTEAGGYKLLCVNSGHDAEKQMAAVHGFVEKEVDYIVIDPVVTEGWKSTLKECRRAKIPVIVVNHKIEDSDDYTTWIGADFKTEGLVCGEWLKEYAAIKQIPEIRALVIEGVNGERVTTERTKGFKEIAKQNGWKILASEDGEFSESGGQKVMEEYIKKYAGKFNVVVCQNDNEAFGAMNAMNDANISYGVDKDVVLVSFDACSIGLQYVLDGSINADFEWNPKMGPEIEKAIQTLENGEVPEKEIYMTEHKYVSEDLIKSVVVNDQRHGFTIVTEEMAKEQY